MILGTVCGVNNYGISSNIINIPIESIKIEKCEMDDFRLDNEYVDSSNSQNTNIIPSINTIFLFLFNDNLNSETDGSNIDTINYYVLKRRNISEDIVSKWTVISKITEKDISNGIYSFTDKTAKTNTKYEYALVPVSTSEGEGTYNTSKIESTCDSLVICNNEYTYSAYMNIQMTEERNSNTTTVTPLMRKFPIVCKIGNTDYSQGTISGLFVGINNKCECDFKNAHLFRKKFYDWLNDGTAKILKFWDGRAFIVATDGKISLDNADNNDFAITKFNYIQIGDIDSENDLKNNGIINIE